MNKWSQEGEGGGITLFYSPPLLVRDYENDDTSLIVTQISSYVDEPIKKKISELKISKYFFFQIQSHSKKCKTSLQDLCIMLPFVKGNLDRYFFYSFAIFFPLSHKLFLLQEKWHKKMPFIAQKKSFQAKSLTLKLNPQP